MLLDAGFGADDGASLLIAFRGLQAESVAQGQVHKSIAHELQTLVAEPFHEWSQEHKVCHSHIAYFLLLSYVRQKRLRERKKAFAELFFPAYEQAIDEVRRVGPDAKISRSPKCARFQS
jgi:hypothetical protein